MKYFELKARKIGPLLTCLGVLLCAWSVKAQEDETRFRKRKFVSLTIGVTTDVKIPFLPKTAYFEGDYKKVTRLQLARSTKTLRFVPKNVGIATLMVLNGDRKVVAEYRIDVKKSDLSKVAREIRALLGDIEGITIKIVNNKVVVDGQILLPSDMNRIYSVVKQYDGKASSLVTLSPLAQKKIAEFIERDINVPEIHVRAVNGKFLLEGYARSEGEKQKAEIIAKTYVPDIVVEEGVSGGLIQKPKVDPVINLIVVKAAPAPEPRKIIQMVVHYVELKKNYLRSFGFHWNPSLEDGSSFTFQQDSRKPGGFVSTITATINNLLPRLNSAKEHGHARVLQSSSLLVIDGQKGELRSVTRVPYTIAGENGTPSTNFEDAGMITNITPSILGARSDSIQLDLEFAVKTLVGITDSGPLISDNNMKTTIVVRSGNSAAIGGLVTNNTKTDYNKLPDGSSSNPILSLNTSRAFNRDQSQFVVFVTPIIKTSASQGAEKIKRKMRLRD